MRPPLLKPDVAKALAAFFTAFLTAFALGVFAAEPLKAANLPPAAGRHVARRPLHYAHRPIRLALPTSVAFQRADQRSLASASAFQRDRLPTAFDYRLARNGPIGSVGFHRPTADGWEPNDTSRGLASSLHLDRPESTFGARLSLPLR